ncbi:MAG: hypothetical protein ACYC5K_02885 [Saccharofermentanales bacterium]
MKLSECIKLLDATIHVMACDMDMEIRVACGADLMSDVMAFSCAHNDMMLTGLVNPQTIRTAEMVDVKAIVFVRGKAPDNLMCELAEQKSICLVSTPLTMFTACGRLHGAGVKGKGE